MPDSPPRDEIAELSDGSERVRVVLADDSVLVREGVARLLTTAGIEVVAQAGDVRSLMTALDAHHPDVAIVDIRMPPTKTREGLDAARDIQQSHPDVGVLLLSSYMEVDDAMDLLSMSEGSLGYLLKDSVTDVDEFVAAVRRVAAGGSTVDPALVAELVGRQRRRDPLETLTPRERDVLELMAHGRSNAGIARELWVTEGSVEKYIKSILQKLDIPPDAEANRRVVAVLAYLNSQ